MFLPGCAPHIPSPLSSALNMTLLHFPLSFSCCLLSTQQFSSELLFHFNWRHSFIFTVSHVSLCWSIQSLCWRVPCLPSVFSQYFSFSSPYSKACCFALIFISHVLRSLVLCFSLLNNDHICFSFIFKVFFSFMLRHIVFPQFLGHWYLSVFVSSFPTFLLSFLLLSQGSLFIYCLLHSSPFSPKSCLSPLQDCFMHLHFFQFPT